MDDKSPWIGWTKQLVAQHQGEEGEEGAGGGETAKKTTLVFFRGAHLDERAKSRRDDAIRIIAALYGAVGAVSARANVVPLFQFCGWTLEKVLQAWDISAIYAAQPLCWQWLDACRASSALPPRVSLAERDLLSKFAPAAPSSSACFEGSGSKYECECSTSTCAAMDEVCVGGTFDRVHAGHRLLLASTAAVCRKIVYMGITGEALLAKKRHRELLEPFEARQAAAVGFIRAVNPDLQVAAGVLDDKPPLAMTSASLEGIVVSRETVAGAESINRERKGQGFRPLAVITVGLVAGGQESGETKLSSTDLRERDAKKRHIAS